MMEVADVDYGALISNDIEYIFELTDFEGNTVERELPGYPEGRQKVYDSVLSRQKLHFRLWRTLDLIRDTVSPQEYHHHVFHALFRKLVSQQEDIGVNIESLDEKWITTVDKAIERRYPAYSPSEAPTDTEIQRKILRSLEGVSIENIQPRAARAFTELIDTSRSPSEFITPLRVADAIVDLAGPSEGDQVLDPAAGIGNIIREVARRGADASAIEINRKTTNHALFLNSVLDVPVKYEVADFLLKSLGDDSSLPTNQDHFVIDPPFGLTYERPDGTIERDAEELFILESLKHLKPGGTVTAVISQGSLFKKRSEEFRQKITSEYRLTTIVEIDKPIFEHTAIPTAIVQIRNEPSHTNAEIQYQIVEESDPDEELDRAVETIEQNEAPTLSLTDLQERSFLPSEVIGVEKLTEQVKEKYEQVVPVHELANEIRTGVTKTETLSEPNEDTLPFLRPKDVSEGEPDEFIIPEEDTVIAGPGDVLVSVKGHTSLVHTPSTRVVPASNWAVLRFDSPEEALVYSTFFESDLGQDQLETLRTGTAIPYIPLRRFRDILVPHFPQEEIIEKAEEIRSLQEKAREFERQRAALEDELEDLI